MENGFNVGRGGRAKFQSLLKESGDFDNVFNVVVLDELGPRQEPPTPSPVTQAPTQKPTPSPTFEPIPPLTASPTLSPTTASPTRNPTASPTSAPSPSIAPSMMTSPSPIQMAGVTPRVAPPDERTDMPSTEPSATPAVAATPSREKTPAYVIAAIVIGGCAVLMACCFSVFLCRNNLKDDELRLLPNGRRDGSDVSPPARHGNRMPSSKESPTVSQQLSTLPFVPDMVLMDDDHRSLANTTLGEHTAGRKPPKKKRMVDMDVTMKSFDDESLYTSPIGIIPRIQPSRLIDEDDDDDRDTARKTIRSPPTLESSTNFDDDIFFPLSDTGSSSQESRSWGMSSSPMRISSLMDGELGPAPDNDPEALSKEHRSAFTESRDDVDGSPWPTQQLSPRSSHSSLTHKAENIAGFIALTSSQSSKEDDHSIADASGTYASSGSASLLHRKKRRTAEKIAKSSKDKMQSPTQLLSTHKEESTNGPNQSKSPMQMLEDEDNKTDVSPIDMDDGHSFEGTKSTPSSERPPVPLLKPHFRTPTKTDTEGRAVRHSVSPYRKRYLEGLHGSPTAQRELRAIKMEEQARVSTIESPPPASLTEGDVSVSTMSTSVVSADTENPWLFDTVAQCLGPRSASADMESLSGKSNKSWRSHRSSKSLGSRHSTMRRKGGSVGSRRSKKSSFSFGSFVEGRAASGILMAPRSLEHDLKRLELQLESLESTGPSKLPRVSPSPPGRVGGENNLGATNKFSHQKVSSKQRIIIMAPPGKLGVVLSNRHNGTGTVVSELRGDSVLQGALLPGDKLSKCPTAWRRCCFPLNRSLTRILFLSFIFQQLPLTEKMSPAWMFPKSLP